MRNRIHIVGRKNSGKTTLMLEVIAELRSRGLKVGSIKHTSHHHDPEPEGKDSRRHRVAGANPAAVASQGLVGIFRGREDGEDIYQSLARDFDHCDVILVEGDHTATGNKIEVWRKETGTEIMAGETEGIQVIVSNDKIPAIPPGIVKLRRDQVVELVHFIQEMLRSCQ